MMTSLSDPGATGWWPAAGPANSTGRRSWTAIIVMLAGTLAISLVSYSISMSVSAERSAADALRRQNAALHREVAALEAEHRVRMRLPQLERWNREVLGLQPIEARQFLESPLLLANYGRPAAAAPAPTLAVVRDAPAANPGGAAMPPLQRTAVAPAPRPAPKPVPLDPALAAALATLGDGPEPAAPVAGRAQLTTIALDSAAAAAPKAPAANPVPR